jgi:mannosyltransferase
MTKSSRSSDAKTVEQPKYVPVIGPLLFVMLGGVGISAAWLLHTATNYQERFNLGFALHGALSPITQGSPDDPMPLYYLLLHTLAHVTTPSLTLLRVVSLACYALAIPAIYFTAKLATSDKRVGLLAAILLGVSPFMLWYANRATVYAPLLLATVLCQLSFVLLLQKKPWAWPLYALTAVIGLGLHYFFITLLVLQWVFYWVKRHEFRLRDQLIMLGMALALLVGFSLWMHYLAEAIHVFGLLPYAGKPSATNAFIIYVQYLFGFQSVTTTTLIIAFWPLLVIIGLLAVQKYVRPTRSVQYFSFTAFMVILGIFALSWLWRSLFLSSYLIIGLPSFLLVVSWYFVAFELSILAWARAVLVGAMVAMLALQLGHSDFAVQQDYLGKLPAAHKSARIG